MNASESDPNARPSDPFVEKLVEALAVVDLQGLQPGEPGWAPRDEYRWEAEALGAILRERCTFEVSDLRAVWLQWFGDDLMHWQLEELEQIVVELKARAAAP